MDEIEHEHDNFRAVLRRVIKQKDAETAVWLCAALGAVWTARGYWLEGQHWLEEALSSGGTIATETKAKAYLELATIVGSQRSGERAIDLLHKSLALYRELNDGRHTALVLNALGWISEDLDQIDAALGYYEQGLAVLRLLGDSQGSAGLLANMSIILLQHRQECDTAEKMLDESFAYFSDLHDVGGLAEVWHHYGYLAYIRGEYVKAWEHLRIGLAESLKLGNSSGIVECLEALGLVANKRDHPNFVFELMGTAESIRNALGFVVTAKERQTRDAVLLPIRAQLGEAGFAQLWASLCTRTIHQAYRWIEDFLLTDMD